MRFICDTMLGKLAKYLRILGMDAPYVRSPGDLEKLIPSEGRYYFLTKRRALQARPNVILIRSDLAREQIREIVHIIRASVDRAGVMARCIACNLPLMDISKTDAERHVPEFVYHRYETFRVCPLCGKVYWEGSHAAHMSAFVEEVLGEKEKRH